MQKLVEISARKYCFKLIADLFSDRSNAIESRVNKPRIPRRLPIIYYRFG